VFGGSGGWNGGKGGDGGGKGTVSQYAGDPSILVPLGMKHGAGGFGGGVAKHGSTSGGASGLAYTYVHFPEVVLKSNLGYSSPGDGGAHGGGEGGGVGGIGGGDGLIGGLGGIGGGGGEGGLGGGGWKMLVSCHPESLGACCSHVGPLDSGQA